VDGTPAQQSSQCSLQRRALPFRPEQPICTSHPEDFPSSVRVWSQQLVCSSAIRAGPHRCRSSAIRQHREQQEAVGLGRLQPGGCRGHATEQMKHALCANKGVTAVQCVGKAGWLRCRMISSRASVAMRTSTFELTSDDWLVIEAAPWSLVPVRRFVMVTYCAWVHQMIAVRVGGDEMFARFLYNTSHGNCAVAGLHSASLLHHV